MLTAPQLMDNSCVSGTRYAGGTFSTENCGWVLFWNVFSAVFFGSVNINWTHFSKWSSSNVGKLRARPKGAITKGLDLSKVRSQLLWFLLSVKSTLTWWNLTRNMAVAASMLGDCWSCRLMENVSLDTKEMFIWRVCSNVQEKSPEKTDIKPLKITTPWLSPDTYSFSFFLLTLFHFEALRTALPFQVEGNTMHLYALALYTLAEATSFLNLKGQSTDLASMLHPEAFFQSFYAHIYVANGGCCHANALVQLLHHIWIGELDHILLYTLDMHSIFPFFISFVFWPQLLNTAAIALKYIKGLSVSPLLKTPFSHFSEACYSCKEKRSLSPQTHITCTNVTTHCFMIQV